MFWRQRSASVCLPKRHALIRLPGAHLRMGVAKVTGADTARKALDKENTDLWNQIQKFAAERNQLKVQQASADSAVNRANMDVALRKRTVQSAETLVAQSTEKKLTSEKLLADAKATLDKRARAQFK